MDKTGIRSPRAPAVAAGAVAFLLAAPIAGTSSALAAEEPAALSITDFAFSQATTRVTVGDTISWTNNGKVAHLAKAADAPVKFASPKLTVGESWSFTVTRPGTYSYGCTLHPAMKAKIVAVAATGTEGAAATTATLKKAALQKAAQEKAAAAAKKEAEATAAAELASASKPVATENSLPLFVGGVAIAAVLGLIARARRPAE